METEAFQHRLDPRLHPCGIGGVKQQFQLANLFQQITVRRRTRIEFNQLVGKAVDFFAQRHRFAKGRFRLLPQRAAADVDPFLRQIADARALRGVDHARGRRDDSRHTLHQRGLSRAVVTGEGNALARLDGKRKIVE